MSLLSPFLKEQRRKCLGLTCCRLSEQTFGRAGSRDPYDMDTAAVVSLFLDANKTF